MGDEMRGPAYGLSTFGCGQCFVPVNRCLRVGLSFASGVGSVVEAHCV